MVCSMQITLEQCQWESAAAARLCSCKAELPLTQCTAFVLNMLCSCGAASLNLLDDLGHVMCCCRWGVDAGGAPWGQGVQGLQHSGHLTDDPTRCPGSTYQPDVCRCEAVCSLNARDGCWILLLSAASVNQQARPGLRETSRLSAVSHNQQRCGWSLVLPLSCQRLAASPSWPQCLSPDVTSRCCDLDLLPGDG